VNAGALDAGMGSPFPTGGAGMLLTTVGTLALLLQRTVQQDVRTEVQLPRLMTTWCWGLPRGMTASRTR
jgi:hypothetical protein